MVAEEKHFGRAARRLNVAQSALSRRIADLEADLGFTLFDRGPKGARLTSPGAAYLEGTREALFQLQNAGQKGLQVARGKAGSLTIGFTESAVWHGTVPLCLAAFRSTYPSIELRLNGANSMEQLKALAHEQIDAGFLYYRPHQDPRFDAKTVSEARVMLAVAETHRLTAQRSVSFRDLGDEPFVFCRRDISPPHADRLVNFCERGGLRMNVVQEAPGDAAALSLVAAGVGVAWTPSSTEWRKPNNVVLIAVKDMDLTLPLEIVWRYGDRSPALDTFLRVLETIKFEARSVQDKTGTSKHVQWFSRAVAAV